MNEILERLKSRPNFVSKKLSNYIEVEGCWIYQGKINDGGYGQFELSSPNFKPKKKKIRAHRASYALHYGIDPLDKLVCHSCDTPACINPKHLWLGTTHDNMRDMAIKGRAARQDGINNHSAKLSHDDVREIRRQIAKGRTNVSIAKDFPVTHSTVSLIRLGKKWSDVA